jgi:hypothetical protein
MIKALRSFIKNPLKLVRAKTLKGNYAAFGPCQPIITLLVASRKASTEINEA